MKVNYVAVNNIGGRSNQEDALLIHNEVVQENDFFKTGYVENNTVVFAVCDGMGGHSLGEVASKWTVERLKGLSRLYEINEDSIRGFLYNIQIESCISNQFQDTLLSFL